MEDLRSLADLLDLQALDSEIDRLLDRRANLPELAAYRAAHEELVDLERRLATIEERVREIDLAIDKGEGELRIDEDKAEREERRLYAGGLSARDAEHLRAEVEMLRRRISGREVEVLESMEERDGLAAAGAALEEERATVGAEKARVEEVVGESWREIDTEVVRLEARKGDVVPLIEEDLVTLYEDIRATKEGVAIARLGEGVCGACHLTLSAAEQVQAAKEFPPRCIHCRRMLVIQ